MPIYSLSVTSADPYEYRWVIVTLDAPKFEEHSIADCDYDSYEAALNAGTLELARLDNEPYENEAADPVGDGCE
jgi:hypothetical protein